MTAPPSLVPALPFHDAWARTPDGTIVLACNTKQVPDIPAWNSALVQPLRPCIDGRWGLFEYSLVPQSFDPAFPYLAWMPAENFRRLSLPTKINSFRVVDDLEPAASVFVRHPNWKHRGYLQTSVREELQRDVIYYIKEVDNIIAREENPESRLGSPEVKPPVIALVRAHNSAFCTRIPHLTYRDLLEYIAGLQRATAELQAYTLWYDRIQYGAVSRSTRSFELGLRGSIANCREEFLKLSSLGVPVWWQAAVSSCNGLDASKETARTALKMETRVWEDVVLTSPFLRDVKKGRLVHNKPLEYYPPLVTDSTKYESAARGYSLRSDVVHRDTGCLKDVLEMVEKTSSSGANHTQSVNLAGEIRAAGERAGELIERYAADRAIAPTAEVYAPAPTHSKPKGGLSKWLRQFRDMKQAVLWAPKLIGSWELASHNNDYYPLIHNIQLEPKCKDLLLYVLPPPHLFKGVQSAAKLQTYFFIWMCIRRPWLSRIHRAANDPAVWGFTTQTWRDILSGHYWKLRHPKDCETRFDAREFWKSGGPLIFEDDDIGSFEPDISPHLQGSESGRLEPVHFLNDGVKALILWDLALCHSQLQLDRADEVLSAALIQDAEARSIRRTRRADIFFSPGWNWSIPRETPPWEKPLSERSHRHWLSRLLEIVKDWPCAGKMAWFLAENRFEAFKPDGDKQAEAVFCGQLSEGKLHMLETCMVAVYYQGVFDALGILAIGICERPSELPEMEPFYLM